MENSSRKVKIRNRTCLYCSGLIRTNKEKNRRYIKMDRIGYEINYSSLTGRQKEELTMAILKYYGHGRSLSAANRRLLWYVKDCQYIKYLSIAKIALPPKEGKSITSNK